METGDGLRGGDGLAGGEFRHPSPPGDRKEPRQVEEASERWFRSLIENSYDAVTVLNADGTMRYISPSFERMTGYSPKELVGMSAFDFVHPEDLAAIASLFAEKIEEPHSTATAEYRYRHADGRWRWMEAAGRNLLSDESVQGIVVNYHDITERKEAEERLRAANRELEAFAHTLSHDLRGMLSTAYGYARMLERVCGDALDPEKRAWLEEIIETLSRIDRFTVSLLEYAQAGVPEGMVMEISLREALDTALRGLESMFMKKGVEFTASGELPTVRADATRLQQVLHNLLHNAAKHAGAAGRKPRVTLSASLEGGEVVVAVRDNGKGIPEEKLGIVFEPFVRLRGESSSAGLGIGLSTVRRAVEGWGGRVWAESEPGKGSIFFFTLPPGSAPDTRQELPPRLRGSGEINTA